MIDDLDKDIESEDDREEFFKREPTGHIAMREADKAELWYIAPEGVEIYDKYRDTMKPYGFTKDGHEVSRNLSSEEIKRSRTYHKKIDFKK